MTVCQPHFKDDPNFNQTKNLDPETIEKTPDHPVMMSKNTLKRYELITLYQLVLHLPKKSGLNSKLVNGAAFYKDVCFCFSILY